jgi:hypothetical protein
LISTLDSTDDSAVNSGSLLSDDDLSKPATSSFPSDENNKANKPRYVWIYIIAGAAILIGAIYTVKKLSDKNRLK